VTWSKKHCHRHSPPFLNPSPIERGAAVDGKPTIGRLCAPPPVATALHGIARALYTDEFILYFLHPKVNLSMFSVLSLSRVSPG
jgi:hypothetical protein